MSTAEDRGQKSGVRSQESEGKSAISGDAEKAAGGVWRETGQVAGEFSSEAKQFAVGVSGKAEKAARLVSSEAEEGQRQVAARAGEAAARLSGEAERVIGKLSGQAAQQADKFLRQEEQAAGNTSRRALGHFRLLLGLAPALPVAALAALAIFSAIWWMEHDAQLHSDGALKEVQRQTNAQVADLQAKADAAVRDANQRNTRVIADLQVARARLEQQSRDLASRFESLQQQEQTHRQEIAALPAPEIARRLQAELGPGAFTVDARSTQPGVSGAEQKNSEFQIPDSRLSGASSKLPSGTTGVKNSEFQIPDSRLSRAGSAQPLSSVVLTEAGARKVVQSLSELRSCREESRVQAEQLSSCQQQTATNAQIVEKQKSSIAELNQALAYKDQILARRQTEFKAELKVARGSLLSRVGRVAEYVAAGIVIGKVLK